MAAKTLMIQGTASHVGKSVLVTALCRLFLRQGLKVAPFKAQNMSNNSFVTPDGREIGRAQALQAAACRLAPRVDFNPVLIKPEGERRAQLVVNGKVAGSLEAKDFGRIRRECLRQVAEAFQRLASEFDLVILEGAGSPAEINLREQDIVNMEMAKLAQAPVLLVGDIDRGGVFAALVGTLGLLQPEELHHVKGFVINKFRGDQTLLASGIQMIEGRTGKPCLGILPHWGNLRVPQEDSLGWEDQSAWSRSPHAGDPLLREMQRVPLMPHALLTIGVADLPALSNFTDLDALAQEPDVRLVRLGDKTAHALDAMIFPGTKNSALALKFVLSRELDLVAKRVLAEGGTVIGLCGGYQMLGRKILDPDAIESDDPELDGLGLLDVTTCFAREKITVPVSGVHRETGFPIEGYEVHMGRTTLGKKAQPLLDLSTPGDPALRPEGAVSQDGRTWGTYVHGLFDSPGFRRAFLNQLRSARGLSPLDLQTDFSLDRELDRLADFVQDHLDLRAIARIIEQGV